MPQLAPDFHVSEKKWSDRITMVVSAAQIACESYSSIMQIYDPGGARITFVADGIEKVVKGYFGLLRRFKKKHGYAPDGRVNQSKIGALMLEAALRIADRHQLFHLPVHMRGTIEERDLRNEFGYQILIALFQIDFKKVPSDARRDLFTLLNTTRVETEWLAWALRCFCAAYGTPCLVDAGSEESS